MSDQKLFPKLFEPATIGKVRIKNRLVMLPMGTAYAAPSGEVTQRTIDHYVRRAKGGVGLITVGNVSPYLPNAINQLVLDSDWVLMGHFELVEKVHAAGARITAQLSYSGKQKYVDALRPGEELVSSSPIPTSSMGKVYPVPKELTEKEIFQFIERYVKAAERAKRVGYDIVELHGANGYFINQFMSPFMNKRKDDFGGSLENRMRFPLELIRSVREAVGPDLPIGFRISAVEFVPGGITLEESTRIAQMLEAAGVAYISVSAGVFETNTKTIDLMSYPEGWKEYIWEAVKKSVKIPIVGGGGLKHPDFCEKILEQGKADFIGLGRPLLADPDWPRKAQEERVEDIRMCISCNECLYGSSRRRQGGGARYCAVNAATGRDREFDDITPAPRPKKVMVIGAGPAGMEAARMAAFRGHHVTIYEKTEALGGQLLMAGKPQSKSKVLWLRDYLVNQLKTLGVKIELGLEVTPKVVEENRPNAVVVATGAEIVLPSILDIRSDRVVSAWDVLRGKVNPTGEKVVVVGGGLVGCELVDYLLESKNEVIIVEQLPSLAPDMEPMHRYEMLERFQEKKVTIAIKKKVVGFGKRSVRVVNLDNGQEELFEGDWVFVAMGRRPVDALLHALKGKNLELYSVGDSNEPRVILEAIYEGSLAGRQI